MLGNIIIRTAAINETVELFDKEYRCIRYEVINDRGEVYAEIWITPGVGIVKVWQQINLMTYYSNLKTYKIK